MLRLLSAMAMISTTLAMSVLTPGANVVVVGGGAIQSLAARLAALRGFSTTVALPEQDMGTARALIFDDANPEGTLPVKLMAISGPEADSPTIEACVENAEGLIICFDNEQAFMPESAMKIFTAGGNLKHIALMSRYLNGEGMGFFPNAAKVAANSEIWAGTDAFVKQFKTQDAMIQTRAKELGASYTIIRAGTLKGGASADAAIAEGGGESDFLNPFFYTLGQQDVVSLVPLRCVLRRLGGLCCLAARVQCTVHPPPTRSSLTAPWSSAWLSLRSTGASSTIALFSTSSSRRATRWPAPASPPLSRRPAPRVVRATRTGAAWRRRLWSRCGSRRR